MYFGFIVAFIIVFLFTVSGAGAILLAAIGYVGAKVWQGASENSSPDSDDTLEKMVELLVHFMREPTRSQYKTKFLEQYKIARKGETPPCVMDFESIGGKIHYMPGNHAIKANLHKGQRKLFLTELRFILEHITPERQVYVVYAGAAPSNHTGLLSNLFPNIKFILVDPNPFSIIDHEPDMLRESDSTLPPVDSSIARTLIKAAIKSTNKITVINDYYTDTLSEAVAELLPMADTYFISDIRTNFVMDSKSTVQVNPDTFDILLNTALQYSWITIMKPRSSMIKWRFPFYAESREVFEKYSSQPGNRAIFDSAAAKGIDYITQDKKLLFYYGKMNIQPWAGISSTETRLIIQRNSDGSMPPVHDYGAVEDYESTLFYYNSVIRWMPHHNPYSKRETARDTQTGDTYDRAMYGFDHCNDCSIEAYLWELYKKVYRDTPLSRKTVLELVYMLTGATGVGGSLLAADHGRLFPPGISPEMIIRTQEKRIKIIEDNPSIGDVIHVSIYTGKEHQIRKEKYIPQKQVEATREMQKKKHRK